jgi:sec-independent protein translocase protein TatB
MFDFAWSEIALVGIVALIAIGPKDLPVAIKTVAELVKKARRMAGEFQTHVDEMVREANLGEVRDQFNDLRRMDIKGKILEAVDGDKTLRNTIADNPFKDALNDLKTDINPAPPPVPVHDSEPSTAAAAIEEQSVAARPEHVIAAPAPVIDAGPPPFIPPAVAATGLPSKRPRPPAFVPPAVVAAAASRSAYASPYA